MEDISHFCDKCGKEIDREDVEILEYCSNGEYNLCVICLYCFNKPHDNIYKLLRWVVM